MPPEPEAPRGAACAAAVAVSTGVPLSDVGARLAAFASPGRCASLATPRRESRCWRPLPAASPKSVSNAVETLRDRDAGGGAVVSGTCLSSGQHLTTCVTR